MQSVPSQNILPRPYGVPQRGTLVALLGPTLAAVSDKEDGEDLSFNLAYGANQTRLRLKRGL